MCDNIIRISFFVDLGGFIQFKDWLKNIVNHFFLFFFLFLFLFRLLLNCNAFEIFMFMLTFFSNIAIFTKIKIFTGITMISHIFRIFLAKITFIFFKNLTHIRIWRRFFHFFFIFFHYFISKSCWVMKFWWIWALTLFIF